MKQESEDFTVTPPNQGGHVLGVVRVFEVRLAKLVDAGDCADLCVTTRQAFDEDLLVPVHQFICDGSSTQIHPVHCLNGLLQSKMRPECSSLVGPS